MRMLSSVLLSLLVSSAFSQTNLNTYPYNLFGTNQISPFTNGLDTLNSLYPTGTNSLFSETNSLYPGTNSLYPGTNSLYPGTNSFYPGTNPLYLGTNTNPLYQSTGTNINNPLNPYNQLYPQFLQTTTMLPTQNNLNCEYRLYQGCMAPQTSGCRNCVQQQSTGLCQCLGNGGFGFAPPTVAPLFGKKK